MTPTRLQLTKNSGMPTSPSMSVFQAHTQGVVGLPEDGFKAQAEYIYDVLGLTQAYKLGDTIIFSKPPNWDEIEETI